MKRKFIYSILLLCLAIFIAIKSPLSAIYNYNKAKSLYDKNQYEQSIPYFEKSLIANSKDPLVRFFYARALAASKPTYSIQKKLHDLSESKIDDQATKYAKAQVANIRNDLLKGLENTYIYEAVQSKDIIRWDIRKFPLKYYIKNEDTAPTYYIEAIVSAMGQWQSRTNFVKFQRVYNLTEANIIISFSDNNSACSSGRCKYTVANTTPKINNSGLLMAMDLIFYKTDPFKNKFSRQEIYATALHELGHTLGIMGHSNNPADIMYSFQEGNSREYSIFGNNRLSDRDVRTLVLLYRLSPTISNTKNLQNESFYYAPVILGSSNIQAERKIEELKSYINKYPKIASGYINLGATYADIGDYTKALQYLRHAELLATTQEERYLVAYNRAMIYFNMQDLSKSLEYANIAQSIQNDPNIAELIVEINKLR